jgi:hypothetical protein
MTARTALYRCSATLISLIQGSVKDQPKHLSSISRNTVNHQPNPDRPASGEVIHCVRAPGRIRTCDTFFRREVLFP